MDDKVVDVEGFDPAGMTREELIETVVRLPHARSASVTLRKRTSSSARNFRGSARRRVVGDDREGAAYDANIRYRRYQSKDLMMCFKDSGVR